MPPRASPWRSGCRHRRPLRTVAGGASTGRRAPEIERERGGQVGVRDPANSVGPELHNERSAQTHGATEPVPDDHRADAVGGARGGGTPPRPADKASLLAPPQRWRGEAAHRPRRGSVRSARGRTHRFVNCLALRALTRPYFLLSFFRGSWVSKPAFFSVERFSGSSFGERTGERHAHRAGLAANAATGDRGVDVEALGGLEHTQRLDGLHAVRRVVKYVSNGRPLTVSTPVPGRSRVRAMASLRRPVVWVSGAVAMIRVVPYDLGYQRARAVVRSSGAGAWAPCGWSGPAYTFSFVSIWRPSGPFGSMPLIVRRTASAGFLSSSSA